MMSGSSRHIHIRQFDSNSLLVEWPKGIDQNVAQEILAVQTELLQWNDQNLMDVIPSYDSLLIDFDGEKTTSEQVEDQVLNIISKSGLISASEKIWQIPVSYDGEDLDFFCDQKGLEREELIRLHTAPIYFVYFIGFLPGFLYLGDLPKALHLPRRSSPRARVPKGAVAIGGQQTGIYPQESPGGWHIIGHTNYEWFSKTATPPSKILPGHRVQFIAE